MNSDKKNSYAKAEMLIRKPVSEVFSAFIDPDVTTKFWFTKSSGKVQEGKEIEWTWEMYGVSTPVKVKSVIPNEKILIEWGSPGESSVVEWTFTPLGDHTFVSIVNDGFKGEPEKVVADIRDSTEGFTIVLAGLKAFLEHHLRLNLVGDRFPEEMRK